MVLIIAIGDIHGCFDPLKALVRMVEQECRPAVDEIEYIFVGDYIDRGPSTREVLDFLIDLDAKKTFLMGNHEDMLLMYHKGSDVFEEVGNAWLTKNNGGLTTVRDLDPDSKLPGLVLRETRGTGNSREYVKNRGEFKLKRQYEAFFEDLEYACERTIEHRKSQYKLLFSHSVPNEEIPIEKILECDSFERFHEIRKSYNISPDRTNVWNREFRHEPFGDYTVIHGHTPTISAKHYLRSTRFAAPSKAIKYNKESLKSGGVLMTRSGETNRMIQIDIDTGAVYGNRLSGIILPENDEEYDALTGVRGIPFIPTIDIKRGYYYNWMIDDSEAAFDLTDLNK